MEDMLEELRQHLHRSVEKNPGEAILFSGGLDTSILALLSSASSGVNMRLNGYGEDLKYAQMLAGKLGLNLYTGEVSVQEAIEAIPDVILILESFDPALPNDLAIYMGLLLARDKGIQSIITGDGADELFAGYSYMFGMDLEEYLPRLSRQMQFSSNRLGKHMGIEIKQPFLDKELVEFALSIRPELKVRKHDGQMVGKWILRQAFSSLLPGEIVWQTKRPIEMGSGFTRLHDIIGDMIGDEEMEEAKKRLPIGFLSKDHLFYYKTYFRIFGEVPAPRPGEAICPGCGTGITPQGRHCRVCGWSERL